jgi:predicted TIM-barrel fold metal-dependent hydrolase
LYDFCVEYNVPITAHCNPGGFLVHKDFAGFSSPFKWESVLKKYKNLRLNLAHFGGVERDEWRGKIADMILEKDPETGEYKYESLYTDISYQGVDEVSYRDMMNFINGHDCEKRTRLLKRIIFGSDFMINLQDISSYSKYLRYFIDAKALTLEEKDMLCNQNAERFLYIG